MIATITHGLAKDERDFVKAVSQNVYWIKDLV